MYSSWFILPPAAKTLFEKRVLDSQKLFIKISGPFAKTEKYIII